MTRIEKIDQLFNSLAKQCDFVELTIPHKAFTKFMIDHYDQIELAKTYLEDGATNTAMGILNRILKIEA